MADIYPYPTVNQTTNINEFAGYINQITGNLFFPLVLFAFFVIIVITTMWLGFNRSVIFASFFCSILSIFLVVANLLNPMYMYLLFVMLASSILWSRLTKSSKLPQI